MAVSTRNGWGLQTAQFAVSQVVGGQNTVIPNVGVAVSVVPNGSVRLAKLLYRVDLAPDVAIGTVAVPVLWRLFAIPGTLPPDLSAYQQQAFAVGAHPEIPKLFGGSSPQPLLLDVWLDFSAGDPGLNRLAPIEFPDAGPSTSETLNIVLMPIIDANFLTTAPVGVAQAIATIMAFGTGVTVNPQGSSYGAGGDGARSLPRFDVGIG